MPDDDYPERFAPAIAVALSESLALEGLRGTLAQQLGGLGDVVSGARQRWTLTGSGDSLFAAMAMRPALARWTGLDVEVRTALELARYEVALLDPARDLVIAISNSGSSSRTRETVALSRDRGIMTLGISGAPDGPLARTADRVLLRPVAPVDGLPARWGRVFLNMSEYLAALLALSELGLAVAVARGRMAGPAARAVRAAIGEAIDGLPADAARVEEASADLASSLRDLRAIWSIGGGPGKGTAAYVAAKFHEQVPIAGIRQDLEEWAHLEYFLTLSIGRESVVLVHAPPGAAMDRARELARGIGGAGGRAIVVTAAGEAPFEGAEALLPLSPVDELLTPFSYHLPGQLLALHLARVRGVPHIPLRRTDDRWLIRGGIVRTTADGLP